MNKYYDNAMSIFKILIERHQDMNLGYDFTNGYGRLLWEVLIDMNYDIDVIDGHLHNNTEFMEYYDATISFANTIYTLMKGAYYMGVERGLYPASEEQRLRPKQYFVYFDRVTNLLDDSEENEAIRIKLYSILNKLNDNKLVVGGECGVLIKQVKDTLTAEQYNELKSITPDEYEQIKHKVPRVGN